MTVEQLHDAIGMLDPALVEQADLLRQAPRKEKKLARWYPALAACLACVLCGGLVFGGVKTLFTGYSSAAPQAAPAEAILTERNQVSEDAALGNTRQRSPESGGGEEGAMDTGAAGLPALLAGGLTVEGREEPWTNAQTDGTKTREEAVESAQSSGEALPVVTAEARELPLSWSELPEQVGVRCWRWEEDQTKSEAAVYSGGALTLRSGDWVYEVTARWGQRQGRYVFRGIWEEK